jgi:anaerobic magnesium-protoporphyrin IX monomethyl ester cyclase
MPDVLLAHSNFARLDPKQVERGQPYLPLGTLYAAAVLREAGFSVEVFDATFADGPADFERQLHAARPQAVILYEDSFNWLSKMCLETMRQAALEMVRVAKAQGLPVLCHGSDAADHPLDYLRAGARAVAVGEGEQTALGWAQAELGFSELDTHHLDHVPGLVLLDGEKTRKTAPRPLMQDLDAIPWPARDLVRIEDYRQAWKARHGRFVTNLVTTRGCPYLCNWCSKPIYGNTYHQRDPGDVAKEAAMLAREYGADGLWFADDILGLKRKWLAAFADAVEAGGARRPFWCQTRADLMAAPGAARDLARAGAAEAWLGVESGAQTVLDAMDKGITLGQVKAAREALEAHGVRTAFFLQFGYPGEDWEQIQATRRLLRELVPDDIGVSVAYPQPGTGFHAAVAARLGEKLRWETSGDLDPLFTGMFRKPFYGALHQLVHAELKLARGARAGAALARAPLGLSGEKVLALAQAVRAVPQWVVSRSLVEVRRRTQRSATPGAAPAPRRPSRHAGKA